ncbi:hypothetical protein EFP23_10635 [Lacticaseibacillus paracasei]|nr:hypothetical protein [Lacticaseibacillus paracasei]MCT3345001.1 hypothetical protein [Lacticaseibacillus paracasei]
MLCKHHFSKNGQVFFHIFWVVTLIMQSRKFLEILMVWHYPTQLSRPRSPFSCQTGQHSRRLK